MLISWVHQSSPSSVHSIDVIAPNQLAGRSAYVPCRSRISANSENHPNRCSLSIGLGKSRRRGSSSSDVSRASPIMAATGAACIHAASGQDIAKPRRDRGAIDGDKSPALLRAENRGTVYCARGAIDRAQNSEISRSLESYCLGIRANRRFGF